jgi:hypothetical protein
MDVRIIPAAIRQSEKIPELVSENEGCITHSPHEINYILPGGFIVKISGSSGKVTSGPEDVPPRGTIIFGAPAWNR